MLFGINAIEVTFFFTSCRICLIQGNSQIVVNNQLGGLGLYLLGFEEKNKGQNSELVETFISFLKLLKLLKNLINQGLLTFSLRSSEHFITLIQIQALTCCIQLIKCICFDPSVLACFVHFVGRVLFTFLRSMWLSYTCWQLGISTY